MFEDRLKELDIKVTEKDFWDNNKKAQLNMMNDFADIVRMKESLNEQVGLTDNSLFIIVDTFHNSTE